MEKIKAIFLDFDWTLFDHKTRTFNQKGIEGLNEAHKKGVKLIINSARSYYSLKQLGTFKLLPIEGFVSSNGGSCIIDGKALYTNFINEKIKSSLLKILNEKKIGYTLICQYDSFIKVYDENIVKDFYSVFYEPYPIDYKEYKNEDVLAIQVLATTDNDEWLKKFCEDNHLFFNRFADNNVEITTKEFQKSEGIQKICEYLNLNKDEMMAFGDDINDISMFQIVKYGICLGNGKDEAKKAAYYVTDPIEENGLYNALKHFKVI